MKKLFATIAAIAMMATCSTAAFAAGDETVGDSANVGDSVNVGISEDVTIGESSGDVNVDDDNNVNTGIVLTVVPVALAAGALTASGIVLKKKSK